MEFGFSITSTVAAQMLAVAPIYLAFYLVEGEEVAASYYELLVRNFYQ
jgi:hypothetical protein